MIYKTHWILFVTAFLMASISQAIAFDTNSNGQIYPHGIRSSGLNTEVNFQNNHYDITGGTQKGNNLFHSFGDFNIHSGESAAFHDQGIQNTIGRVTGNQYSWINGQLSSQAENLYLMNPNGWIFGPDASLDVAGSFHVTSADYLKLGEDGRFDATNPEDSILTTEPVSAFGFLDGDVGSIAISGKGERSYDEWMNERRGLHVNDEYSETFIGGNISIKNGAFINVVENGQVVNTIIDPQISAPQGNIHMVSVASKGEVKLHPENQKPDVDSFSAMGKLTLEKEVEINVNGKQAGNIHLAAGNIILDKSDVYSVTEDLDGGDINIDGENLVLKNNAAIITGTNGAGKSGDIKITTTDEIFLSGKDKDLSYGCQIATSANISEKKFSTGDSGSVHIQTQKLMLNDSGLIASNAKMKSNSGSIHITAKKIQLNTDSSINTYSDFGNTGSISIQTDFLLQAEGSMIFTMLLLSKGDIGDIIIDAEESVILKGINDEASSCSIYALNNGLNEDVGIIQIQTKQLELFDGAQIGGLPADYGRSSFIDIDASDHIILSGFNNYREMPGSSIFSITYNQYDAGDISIETNQLLLADGGFVNASTKSTGKAGSISINAIKEIRMSGNDNKGTGCHIEAISAVDQGGNAGDIFINTRQYFLNDRSYILSEAKNSGGGKITVNVNENLILLNSKISSSVKNGQDNGGDINISTNLSILNKSQIIANAYEGTGGNITINSDHLIRSADSIIDASSQLGINGTVNILSPEQDFSRGLNTLPSTFMDATQWLNHPCDQRMGDISSLMIIKRDALPQLPDDLLIIPPHLFLPDTHILNKVTGLIMKGFHSKAISSIESVMNDSDKNIIPETIVLATNYMMLGYKNKAKRLLDSIETLVEKNAPFTHKSLFYTIRGDLALSMGKPLPIIETDLSNGVKYARLTENQQLLAFALNANGNYNAVAGLTKNIVDFAWKNYAEALNELEDTHAMSKAVVLINQARISFQYYSSFDSNKIEKSIQQAFESVKKLDDHWYKGFYLASVYQLIHHYIEKLGVTTDHHFVIQQKELLTQLLSIASSLNNPQLNSYAYGLSGHYYQTLNHTDLAIQYTQKAILTAQYDHFPEIKYRWQWQLARLLRKKGRAELSQTVYQKAIQTIEPIRRQFFCAGRYQTNIFKDLVHPLYMELIHLKLQTPKTDAQNLIDVISLVEQAKIAELQNFYRDECIDMKESQKQLSALLTSSATQFLKNSVIIYPLLSDPPMIIAVFENGPKRIPVPINLKQLKQDAINFHERLNQRSKEARIQYLGNQLYQALIQPLRPYLSSEINTLVFIPDAELRMIPFAALYDLSEKKYLCQSHAVVTLPSLTLTPEHSSGQSPNLLLGGLSLKKDGYSELPDVEKELETIHHIMGGTILKDQFFTPNQVKEELVTTPYNILHFCTHGSFGNHPEFIQLSTYSSPLSLNDLSKLIALCKYRKHPIDLLTLSACETARGDERAALGLGGIAVKTGVNTAIASLWRVEDKAALTIMTSFYQSLNERQGEKAQCLRNAQLSMIASNQFSHPSNWAPFVLIGEWQ